MNRIRRWWIGLVGGAFVGGAVLAASLGATGVFAQTSTPTTPAPSATVQQGNSNNGSQFKSNEDPTHEAAESAQQEAAENSGQAFHGGNCPQGSQQPAPNSTPSS